MRTLALALLFAGIQSATIVLANQVAATHLPNGATTIVNGMKDNTNELFRRQDDAAAGKTASITEQKRLLVRIGENLIEMTEGDYPKVVFEMAAFVLSGGDPKIVDKISRSKELTPSDKRLLQACIVLMKGEMEESTLLFRDINPERLPARLAGRVALARALVSKGEEKTSYLVMAASAMPGTLIEESALRRLALHYAETRNEAALWETLDRYARRFTNSIYAMSFWVDLMEALVSWDAKMRLSNLKTLDRILLVMPTAKRTSVYLSLARAAAVSGRVQLSSWAGRRLGRLALDGSLEYQQAQLYTGLYDVVSMTEGSALDKLRSIPRGSLTTSERALLSAALSIGSDIERPAIHSNALDIEPFVQNPLEGRGAFLLSEVEKQMAELDR